MARGKASETEGKLFAQRLKEAMKGRGLKAATLSAKIKAEQDFTIQRQSISQYIDGQSNPDTERLTAICKALDVSADYLLGLKEDPRIGHTAMDELHLSQSAVDAIKTVSEHGYESMRELFARLITKTAFWTMLSDIVRIKDNAGKPLIKNIHTETAALEAQEMFSEKAVSNIPCRLMYGDDYLKFKQYEIDQTIHVLLQEELQEASHGKH